MPENFTPSVSVLVPVYNVEKYIAKCLASLFTNTMAEECEFIIVDDCSPDGSMQVVAGILEEFPHIKKNIVLRSHDCNRGSAAARNTALLQAHGKYIVCVDSDDWVESDYLEKLYDEAERSGADIIGCNLIREQKGSITRVDCAFPDIEECAAWVLTGRLQGWLWQKMFRRNLITVNNIRWVEGLDLWEDVLFSTKAFCCANKVSSVPEYLYHYRANPTSLVHTPSEKNLRDIIGVVNRIEEFYISKSIAEKYAEPLLMLKARAKVIVVAKAPKYLRKEFMNTFREADPLILRVHSIHLYTRICAWLYLHNLTFCADVLMCFRKVFESLFLFKEIKK